MGTYIVHMCQGQRGQRCVLHLPRVLCDVFLYDGRTKRRRGEGTVLEMFGATHGAGENSHPYDDHQLPCIMEQWRLGGPKVRSNNISHRAEVKSD